MALASRKEPQALRAAWSCYRHSQDRKWIELREELVGLFAKSKEPRATNYLIEALRDPAPSVAQKARRILRNTKRLPASAQNGPTSPTTQRAKPHRPVLTFSPHRALRFSTHPIVRLHTNRGDIDLELYPHAAPIHVANFVGRIKQGLYNGLLWHRVISNFVIQGGDPDGSGWGDGGYMLRAEVNPIRYQRGTLGMPRSEGWNTGSVQIFLTHTPTPHLDGYYTVFGQTIRGLDVLDRIELGDKILKATVLSSPASTIPTTSTTSKPSTRPVP